MSSETDGSRFWPPAAGGRIARQVHLSEGTVRNYPSEAIGKLGTGIRVEACRVARNAGWL